MAFVLVGIAVFLTGAVIGLSPADGPLREDGPAAVVPFLDPVAALRRAPEALALGVGLCVLGLVTAICGAYLGRDRERVSRR